MTSTPDSRVPATPDFAARRRRVAAALDGGALVLRSAPALRRSRDTEYPYRPDSELYWLTGGTEPDTVAVLAGGPVPHLVVFVPERDAAAELWSGPRLGPDEAAEVLGADEAYPLTELERRLPGLLQGARRVHFRMGAGGRVDRAVLDAMERARAKGQRTGTGPRSLVDPGEVLDDLRLVKDAAEIEAIRAACAVTVRGHREGLAAAAPGVGEWVVQAAVDGSFLRQGARGPGFETIVGSGANACVLHYVTNDATIGPTDLVLLDAGAELGLYQGDVTRTFPASGRFSPEQRAVYDVVEAARAAGVAATAPGATVADVHDAALAVVLEGLVELGVLSGAVEDLKAEEAHKPWFPHQTSHWLGIDVHDPGDYARDGRPRVLEPGMVFTVEPGLYFPPGSTDGAARFAGIGVRVEDDVLVTRDGRENLTADLPTDPDALAALVGAAP